jgi:hypothetical protein
MTYPTINPAGTTLLQLDDGESEPTATRADEVDEGPRSLRGPKSEASEPDD